MKRCTHCDVMLTERLVTPRRLALVSLGAAILSAVAAAEVEVRLGEIEQPELERWKREAEANAKRPLGIR